MTNISTEAKIGNQVFHNAMINAGGCFCETEDQLNAVLDSEAGGVITKSATPEARLGNPEPRAASLPLGSINSMGLPNLGFNFYLNFATKDHSQNKPIIMSVAGTSIDQNITMLKTIEKSDFNGLVELNLSCPNVVGKSQVGYDFEAMKAVLTSVFDFYSKPLGVKLPPYFDMMQFDAAAEILNQFPLTYVNCINSIGNGLVINPDDETVLIKPKGGFGGIGGEYIKPTALANVRAMRLRLKSNIKIIGTGGITTGTDIFEHILCGADIVQVGTELLKGKPKVFSRLTNELKECMKAKDYTKLSDFRGKLKEIH